MSGIVSLQVGGSARPSAVIALAAGALICAGAALPWLSFFAGLQSYSGLAGLYGRAVFAGGVLAIAVSAATLVRLARWPGALLCGLGVVLAVFVLWLLIGLRATMRSLGMHAMLVARPGPGLFVALVGALLLVAASGMPLVRSRHRG